VNIYKVVLCETGSLVSWSSHWGVADSIQEAMDAALAAEPALPDIKFEVKEVHTMADCSFNPKKLRVAA